MKIAISSILSALAAVAVVSGFILPNHNGAVPQNYHLSTNNLEDASCAGTTAAAFFISKFGRSNSRLLMSETRTFERREGRGGGGGDSSYERREYQGRGGGRGGRGGE